MERFLCQFTFSPRARNFSLCFLYGCITALGFAPVYLPFICLCISLGAIWQKTRDSSPAFSFWQGWWFGFGYFTVGLYWIAFALGVDFNKFAWLIPFSVFGLPAFLAFFIAPAFWITASATPYLQEEGRLILFALLWTGFEILRGYILTGFPWNLIGYIWMDCLPMIQSLAYIGIYGLSFFTILWAMGLAVKRKNSTVIGIEHLIFIGLELSLILFYGLGCFRSQSVTFVPDLTLRLVQPSVPQKLKWSEQHREENFQSLLKLTISPAKSSNFPQLYIWPESATPFFLGNDIRRRQQIIDALPSESILITGSPRGVYDAQKNLTLWNSLLVLRKETGWIDFYDKNHLVPFGEYIPFRSILPSFIQKVTPGSLDYSAGSGPKTLVIPGIPPFTPVICYEIIFPGALKASSGPQPEWILNITNDAWYGRTSGPYQHFAIAQARAVEEGLPLVRVGNNGISAVIDPYGNIVQKLDLDDQEILDVSLPRPLTQPTFYSIYGQKIIFLILGLALLSVCAFRRKSSEKF